MTIAELAGQIVALVDRQAAAIAGNDFAGLAALTLETERLLQALNTQVAGLTPDERGYVATLLAPAVDQANGLVDTADARLDETRREMQELRQGRSVTSAYRQAMPKQAAISYSRHG